MKLVHKILFLSVQIVFQNALLKVFQCVETLWLRGAIGCRVTTLHQRTDACAGQYKSKHSFGIISTSEQHLNVHHITNYSASGHGKGEVDQAAGFLKTAAKRAVIANTDTVQVKNK